jgi:hypothetical protein
MLSVTYKPFMLSVVMLNVVMVSVVAHLLKDTTSLCYSQGLKSLQAYGYFLVRYFKATID